MTSPIPQHESLTVEFKSDRNRLADRELVAAVVCLANTADAFKRIGLAGRTGRGIDLIYQGLLRYGRTAPSYAQSTAESVVVVLPGGDADLGFLRTVLAEEKRLGRPLSVDALIALALLRQLRRLDTMRLAKEIQRDEDAARRVLATLVEAGLVQAHGATRGRTYTLSAQLYKGLGDTAGYVRQAGFEPIQQEQMVLQYATKRLSENSPWGGPPARLEAKDGSASRPTIRCHGEIRVFG
ncbi:MAG TPA: hypothetical protein VF278_03875 [Pirellulales bacterium]